MSETISIAKFMNEHAWVDETQKGLSPHKKLDYKTWGEIMPVVEKISNMQWTWVNIIPQELNGKKGHCYIEYGMSRVSFSVSKSNTSLIDAIYEAVVEYIMWYNKTHNK